MDWVWAIISMFWTVGAWVVAGACWTTARRWNAMGVIENGVGFRLRREENPFGFSLAYRGTQLVAALGLLFVAIGIAITMGWIARAL